MGASNVGNPNPGDITVSWLADDVINGETVADGTSIFQICFDAIAVDGTSPIAFSGTPTAIEITNTNGIVDLVNTDGEVIVGNGGGGGTPCPGSGGALGTLLTYYSSFFISGSFKSFSLFYFS